MDATDTENRSSREDMPCSLCTQILAAIAEVDDRSLNDLNPLYEVIDPEALDALFAPQVNGSSRTDGEVSFEYAGYWVTVSSEGAVEIDSETR